LSFVYAHKKSADNAFNYLKCAWQQFLLFLHKYFIFRG
jgi:hypothetical protein